jgi:hypothetical protein
MARPQLAYDSGCASGGIVLALVLGVMPSLWKIVFVLALLLPGGFLLLPLLAMKRAFRRGVAPGPALEPR